MGPFAAPKGSPLRGRFPYQGNVPEGTKGVGTLSPKVTERLSQIWYDLSVSAFRRATSPLKGEALDFSHRHGFPYECESIVEPQEEGGESEGGEDVEEQTGAGTDVRSRLDVRFGLQPVEKDLNRLPQGTDAGGYGIFGNKNIVLFPLSRRDERDVPLGLQMGSPFCVDIGTICIEPAVCDRCAVRSICFAAHRSQRPLICTAQGWEACARPQLRKNVQLDAVIPQVLRGISC